MSKVKKEQTNLIRDLKALEREHKELWENMDDDVSPKIIKKVIKFLEGIK